MKDAIRSRRSIRKFSDQVVPDNLVDEILDAGRWAPSGLNNQPWRFAVIRDAGLKGEISGLTAYGSIVRSANVIIAVFFDTSSGYDRTKDLQAIGACIENMLLCIHEQGLGGVWLGEILKSGSEMKALLGAPDTYEFMAAIALGYSKGWPPRAPARKPLSELVFFRK
ncbi:MAG TPA: nitroreductase [Deltaproteobacteria bacterium]|nr:nitroreductase [Deltaproteobacteria bacterium]HQI00241.1 nitroreductase [Deltaproteobacteria bacterium]HQJ08703.1 nitroreductase [Deltaproteobacteria bacterium]